MNLHGLLEFSEEVSAARNGGRPIVALESTIISHGLPYPENVQVALGLEEIIRNEGVVPATIGIIGGTVKVGLTRDEIENLASAKQVWKVSRRDIGAVVSRKGIGATTVAGTMLLANLAGIKVFATGGIGGVHRNFSETLDVSADLTELGRTPVAVISAGAKAILDLPKTLECLETQGVPVVGYQTSDFPAFYTRSSGLSLSLRVDSSEEAASLINNHWSYSQTGIVVANPIPAEAELNPELVERAINRACDLAKTHGISGKDLTPFLLSEILKLTEGKSLSANIALVRNNALLAARIARLLNSEKE